MGASAKTETFAIIERRAVLILEFFVFYYCVCSFIFPVFLVFSFHFTTFSCQFSVCSSVFHLFSLFFFPFHFATFSSQFSMFSSVLWSFPFNSLDILLYSV